jgi:hypothetical protein
MIASLYPFIELLRQKKIYYTLASHREQTVMVRVDVPGQRWEIEFFESGEVEIEIFKSDGNVFGRKMLDDLIEKFGD